METKLNNDEAQKIVDFALQHGILNLDDVQNQLNKKRKKELLAQHAYKIWQGSDSRYRTYIDDITKPSSKTLPSYFSWSLTTTPIILELFLASKIPAIFRMYPDLSSSC